MLEEKKKKSDKEKIKGIGRGYWGRFGIEDDPEECSNGGDVGESVVIDDANGKAYAKVIDIIKNKSIKDYYNMDEAVRIPAKTGNMIDVYFNWRGRYISLKMFFPEVRMPTKQDIGDQIEKAYPGARVLTYHLSKLVSGEPFLQIEGYDKPKEKLKTDRDGYRIPKKDADAARERLLAKAKEKRAELEEDMSGMSQRSGDKRSTKSGAGMTAKGVAKYNRRTGGNLQTAVTTPPSKLKKGSKSYNRRKSFCARSRGWTGERGKAARRRWNC